MIACCFSHFFKFWKAFLAISVLFLISSSHMLTNSQDSWTSELVWWYCLLSSVHMLDFLSYSLPYTLACLLLIFQTSSYFPQLLCPTSHAASFQIWLSGQCHLHILGCKYFVLQWWNISDLLFLIVSSHCRDWRDQVTRHILDTLLFDLVYSPILFSILIQADWSQYRFQIRHMSFLWRFKFISIMRSSSCCTQPKALV